VNIKEISMKYKLCGKHLDGYWLEVVKEKEKERRESESLNEKTKEERSIRKRDHGQLNKQKNPPIDTLEHLVGNKHSRASEALKTQAKLT
jgi:hypothetical protein